jgi:hypothetical protein
VAAAGEGLRLASAVMVGPDEAERSKAAARVRVRVPHGFFFYFNFLNYYSGNEL